MPSSRACQRRECAHQLGSTRSHTPLAWAHSFPFKPEARYAATTSRQRFIFSRSIFTSSSSLIDKAQLWQVHSRKKRWVAGTLTQRLQVIRAAAQGRVKAEAVAVGAQLLLEVRIPGHDALHRQHLPTDTRTEGNTLGKRLGIPS